MSGSAAGEEEGKLKDSLISSLLVCKWFLLFSFQEVENPICKKRISIFLPSLLLCIGFKGFFFPSHFVVLFYVVHTTHKMLHMWVSPKSVDFFKSLRLLYIQ